MTDRLSQRLVDRLPSLTPAMPEDSNQIGLQSASIDQLIAAKARADVLLRNVRKSSTNPFFKSDYADLDAITRVIRPIYGEHGMAFVQAPWVLDGKDVLITTLAHESGQWIRSVMAIAAMPDKNGIVTSQSIGSAISYAKRYSLSAMGNLASTDEDDDGEAAMGRTSTDQPPVAESRQAAAEVVERKPAVVESIEDTLTLGESAEESSLIAGLRNCESVRDLKAWERDNDGEIAWAQENDAKTFTELKTLHTQTKEKLTNG